MLLDLHDREEPRRLVVVHEQVEAALVVGRDAEQLDASEVVLELGVHAALPRLDHRLRVAGDVELAAVEHVARCRHSSVERTEGRGVLPVLGVIQRELERCARRDVPKDLRPDCNVLVG